MGTRLAEGDRIRVPGIDIELDVLDVPGHTAGHIAYVDTAGRDFVFYLYREGGWKELMLEKPEVWGAQELSSKEVTMRLVAKTTPMR